MVWSVRATGGLHAHYVRMHIEALTGLWLVLVWFVVWSVRATGGLHARCARMHIEALIQQSTLHKSHNKKHTRGEPRAPVGSFSGVCGGDDIKGISGKF
ncbi:hypothetical protein PCORN_04597 [Listeria cornellensis FSL F6-0969]|uniref:Uncharacterized protein n=1 Tax=Listeria cornellensis FSL F6-0969 TaxID=1265820 RepID=W7C2X1_9LIST|nr:hypothetical protein PCORN_04597 [Listeria cornellensis FSL F6-0969]